MTITRTSIITSLDPEQVSEGMIANGAIAKNAVYEKYPDDRVLCTQRPSLSITSPVTSFTVSNKGRGIYYWSAIGKYIIVNDNVVYSGDYSVALAQLMTTGKDPVTILEIGDYLVILDAQNNEGWYILSSAPLTLVKIADTDFPGNISGVTIAGGGAVLDGYLFVMGTNKVIYSSALYDPTTWDALDFIKAEREQDQGMYLTKHHDQIVAMGARSIEFFYDAGNPVGSPLARRDDTSYRVGPVDRKAVFSTGDKIYFVGSEKTGGIGLFELVQFVPRKVSTFSIDTYLSLVRSRLDYDFIVAGYTTGPHNFIFITTVIPGSTNWPTAYTLVYDGTNELFAQFDSSIASVTDFGICSGTSRSTSIEREPQFMFLSGDIGIFDLTYLKEDSTGSGAYFTTTDYIVNQNDYIVTIGGNTTESFEFLVRFGEIDMTSVTNKFLNRLSVVGTTTSSGENESPIYISWSDDHYHTFSAERELDTGLNRSLTRCGKFKRRAHQLRYTGSDTLRIEALELDVRASRYA